MPKWLPAKTVCNRYGDISDRTLDRWIEVGALPPPVYIRRRRYWDEEVLNAHDAARQTEAVS
jgi:predicted site-specific integrase-resolvase